MALNNITFTINSGEFIVITGKSGSGKSTLMNILGTLDVPTKGHYILNERSIFDLSDKKISNIRNNEIGFIFQDFNLIPTLNAFENIELPLIYRKIPTSKRYKLCQTAIEEVGLNNRKFHKPYELSGGQQQRIAIARAIAAKPSIILADEPTGNLDSKAGTEILNILKRLNKEGKTVILITHDDKIAKNAEKKFIIKDGKLLRNCS